MNNKILSVSKAMLAEASKDLVQLPKIKQYLGEGADINYQSEEDGYTTLMLAVDRDDEDLISYLLQQGANPLIQNHHQEIASDLALSHSPIYQLLKNYELLFATTGNDVAGVKAALAAGANVNFQGQGGYTALLIAVEQSCLELVELLLANDADLSLERNDRWGAFELAKDSLIFQTLDYGKPFTAEQKRKLLESEDEDEGRWERGRLKALADRKGQPFALSQLKMHPLRQHFKPAPTEAQLTELSEHFGHPLPNSLKEIFNHYNGCRPMLRYYEDKQESSIRHFYFLDENKTSIGNIWWSIENYSGFLGPETLPIGEDPYCGIYFLKWVEGKAEVWLFQYGDQPFAYEDDEDDEDEDKMPTAYSFIKSSLDELLEALYAVEE